MRLKLKLQREEPQSQNDASATFWVAAVLMKDLCRLADLGDTGSVSKGQEA